MLSKIFVIPFDRFVATYFEGSEVNLLIVDGHQAWEQQNQFDSLGQFGEWPKDVRPLLVEDLCYYLDQVDNVKERVEYENEDQSDKTAAALIELPSWNQLQVAESYEREQG
jgi:hypothetical protein